MHRVFRCMIENSQMNAFYHFQDNKKLKGIDHVNE